MRCFCWLKNRKSKDINCIFVWLSSRAMCRNEKKIFDLTKTRQNEKKEKTKEKKENLLCDGTEDVCEKVKKVNDRTKAFFFAFAIRTVAAASVVVVFLFRFCLAFAWLESHKMSTKNNKNENKIFFSFFRLFFSDTAIFFYWCCCLFLFDLTN